MPEASRPKSLRALTNTVCKGLSAFALVDPTSPCIAAQLTAARVVCLKPKSEMDATNATAAAASSAPASTFVPKDVGASKMDQGNGPYSWEQFQTYYPTAKTARKRWEAGIVITISGTSTAHPGLIMLPCTSETLVDCYGPVEGARRWAEMKSADPELADSVRVDPADGMPYTRSSFLQCYGADDGAQRWTAAGVQPTPTPGRYALKTAPAVAAAAVAVAAPATAPAAPAAAGPAAPAAPAAAVLAAAPSPADQASMPPTHRLLTVADLEEVRDSGKARRIVTNLAIKRANGVYMRPTAAEDVKLAWARISKYIASLKSKPAPVMEVASRIWQLSLCRTTPDPQQVAAGLMDAGVVTAMAPSPPSATNPKKSPTNPKKVPLQYGFEVPGVHSAASASGQRRHLQSLKELVPKTLYDELPLRRKVILAEGAEQPTAGGLVAFSWPTRRYTRRSYARHDYDELEEVQSGRRLGTLGGTKVGTGARAKGVVGRMPFEKRGHYARWADWKGKKEHHARAHGGLKKMKCSIRREKTARW